MAQLTAEHNFGEALKIRQAVGRAMLLQTGNEQISAKENLVQRLEEILTLLLPTPRHIRPNLAKFIDMAVDIAKEMTEEQVLFRSFMANFGEAKDDATMHVADEDQSGPVAMCTFPGFEKKVEAGECILFFKACAELETVFL